LSATLSEFIPIRFVFTNKLSEDDKLLLAFDAFALSRFLGFEISLGNIIHGDDYVALKREDFRALHFSAMSSILPQW
jgi:hypothetical protein